jgi:replication factor C subunit 2/4
LQKIPDSTLPELWAVIRSKNFASLQEQVGDFMALGYSSAALFSQFQDFLISETEVADAPKAKVLMRIAHADMCLVDGADEELQIMDVLSFAMRVV